MKKLTNKLQGNAGLHGSELQLKLYMLFLINGHKQKKNFELLCEYPEAGKFDDLVFIEDNETILLQAKHKSNALKKISSEQIFSEKNDFSLVTYLNSFLQTKTKFSCSTNYILCSNIDINKEISDKFVVKLKHDSISIFCDCPKEYHPLIYSFNVSETLDKLSSLRNDLIKDNIVDFLKAFKLIVVNDKNIETVIRRNLKILVDVEKYLSLNYVYDFIFNQLKYWFSATKQSSLTNLHLEAYLSELYSAAFCRDLNLDGNRLAFSDIALPADKQIIVINTNKYRVVCLKLYQQLLQHKKEKELLFIDPKLDTFQDTMLNTFQVEHFTHLIYLMPNKKELLEKIEQLSNKILSKPYKKIIIITKQLNQLVSFKNVYYISDQSPDFYKNIKIFKNFEELPEKSCCYITRSIVDSNNSNTYTEDEFLAKVLYTRNELFLITDVSGMGKTELLLSLLQKLRSNYKNLLTIKIDLNDISELFKTCYKNKQTLELDILLSYLHQFNEYDQQMIMIPGHTVVLLDSFDEINDYAQEIVINFLKNSINNRLFRAVIICNRPHSKTALTQKLKLKHFHLDLFTEQNQLQFIYNYWTLNLNIFEQTQMEKLRKYISEFLEGNFIKSFPLKPVIGIPLLVKMIADIFQNSANKEVLLDINPTPTLNKIWNVAELYDAYFERQKEIYIEKGNPQGHKFATRSLSKEFNALLKLCEYFALITILPHNIYRFFEPTLVVEDICLNEICDIGIITQKKEKYVFVHRTFAEYLVAKRMYFELNRDEVDCIKFLFENVILPHKLDHTVFYFFNEILRISWNKLKPTVLQTCGEVIRSINLQNENYNITSLHMCVQIIKLILEKSNALENLLKPPEHFYFNLLSLAVVYNNLELIQYLIENGANINLRLTHSAHTALHFGAQRKNFEIIKYLIEQGADVNARTSNGEQVIHYAAKDSSLDIVKYLIQEGAELHAVTKNGESVVHWATRYKDSDKLKYLIKCGASVDSKTKNNETVLHWAAKYKNFSAAQYLIEMGADINAITKDRETVLHYAAKSKDFNILKYLIEKGANVNINTKQGETILHYASKYGNFGNVTTLISKQIKTEDGRTISQYIEKEQSFEIVEYLIAIGLDMHAKSKSGHTILHSVAKDWSFNKVRYLIEKGADLNTPTQEGETILHWIARRDNFDDFKYLLENGANINAKTKNGLTVLHCIALCWEIEKVKYFIEAGAHLNAVAENGQTILHCAAYFGDLNCIKYLIEKGADVNARTKNGQTVLHVATYGGNLNMLKYLVKKGVDLNARTETGETILHWAVKNKILENIKYLIEKGADINASTVDGETILHWAVITNVLDNVKYLVEIGVNINASTEYGETVLHIAAYNGNFDLLKYLIDNGADLTAVTTNGLTMLHYVADSNSFKCLKYFVEKGLDVNAKNKAGETALQYALPIQDFNIMKYLIEQGTDVNTKSEIGETVLHQIVKNENLVKVKYLVESGANVNAVTKDGYTVIHYASDNQDFNVVQYLINMGANLNACSKIGETVLHRVAKTGDLDRVKYLVEAGADLNITAQNGETVLHYAADNADFYIVKYLIDKEMNVNAKTLNGQTILHRSAQVEDLQTIKYLIQQGADVNASTNTGNSALYYASSKPNCDIIRFLIEQGADLNAKSENEETLIHRVIKAGDLDSLKYLKNHGMDFNAVTKIGETALHYAAKQKDFDVVKYLLDESVEFNIQSQNGETVLHEAAKVGDLDSIRYLIEKGADVNLKSKDNKTAIDVAKENEHLDCVQFLTEIEGDF